MPERPFHDIECACIPCHNPYTDELEGWMVPFNPWDPPPKELEPPD
jgi:hypothetical protein